MNVYIPHKGELDDMELIGAAKNVVEIGANEPVEIDKMYGPLVAFPIRVYVDFATVEWVVEREFIPHDDKGNALESEWRIMARFPCQTADDFPEAA